jgi:hypothetical protein
MVITGLAAPGRPDHAIISNHRPTRVEPDAQGV